MVLFCLMAIGSGDISQNRVLDELVRDTASCGLALAFFAFCHLRWCRRGSETGQAQPQAHFETKRGQGRFSHVGKVGNDYVVWLLRCRIFRFRSFLTKHPFSASRNGHFEMENFQFFRKITPPNHTITANVRKPLP